MQIDSFLSLEVKIDILNLKHNSIYCCQKLSGNQVKKEEDKYFSTLSELGEGTKSVDFFFFPIAFGKILN